MDSSLDVTHGFYGRLNSLQNLIEWYPIAFSISQLSLPYGIQMRARNQNSYLYFVFTVQSNISLHTTWYFVQYIVLRFTDRIFVLIRGRFPCRNFLKLSQWHCPPSEFSTVKEMPDSNPCSPKRYQWVIIKKTVEQKETWAKTECLCNRNTMIVFDFWNIWHKN